MNPNDLKTAMFEHNRAHQYLLHLDYMDRLHLNQLFSLEFPYLRATEVYLVEFIKLKGLTELQAC